MWLTTHHYDTAVSETRITTYLGIITGQVPATALLRHVAHLPDACDWSWPSRSPPG